MEKNETSIWIHISLFCNKLSNYRSHFSQLIYARHLLFTKPTLHKKFGIISHSFQIDFFYIKDILSWYIVYKKIFFLHLSSLCTAVCYSQDTWKSGRSRLNSSTISRLVVTAEESQQKTISGSSSVPLLTWQFVLRFRDESFSHERVNKKICDIHRKKTKCKT